MTGVETIANKIYSYMKAADWQFTMFSEDGKETVEPELGRYFFNQDPNIMITIDEVSEVVRFHRSEDVGLSQIEHFHTRIRNLVQRYPASFEFKVFGKAIKPQDYASNLTQKQGTQSMATMRITENLKTQVENGLRVDPKLYESACKLTSDNSISGQLEAIAVSLTENHEEVFGYIMRIRDKLENKQGLTEDEVKLTTQIIKSVRLAEGYTVLPPIDRERYTDIPGLEGPMRMRNGQVLYYDPREGRYYDRDRDMYISDEEYFAMDRGGEYKMSEEAVFESKLNQFTFERLFESPQSISTSQHNTSMVKEGPKKRIGSRVRVVKGPYAGKTGSVRQINKSNFGHTKQLDIDFDDGSQGVCDPIECRLVRNVDENITYGSKKHEQIIHALVNSHLPHDLIDDISGNFISLPIRATNLLKNFIKATDPKWERKAHKDARMILSMIESDVKEDVTENNLLKMKKLSSSEYQKAKKLKEGVDRTSPIYKYYRNLKAMSSHDLKDMMRQTHKIVSTSGITKDDMISDLLYSKYGSHRVKEVFGLDEGLDEHHTGGPHFYLVRCYGNFWGGKYYESGIDSIFVFAEDEQDAVSIAKANKGAVLDHFKNKRVGSGERKRPAIKRDDNFLEIRNAKGMPTQRKHHKVLRADGTIGPMDLDEMGLPG